MDSFETWVAVLGDCCARRGLARPTAREVRRCWGQGIEADARTLVRGASPTDLAVEYAEGFERHLGRVRPIEGALPLVGRLREQGLRLAVVTNSPRRVAVSILETLGIAPAFGAICGADEVERAKPAADLVLLALDRLGVCAGDAVMVGDTALDVRAARDAGVRAVGLGVDADLVIASLDEIATPSDFARD